MLKLPSCLLLLHLHLTSSILMPVRLNTPPPLAACLDGSHYVIAPALHSALSPLTSPPPFRPPITTLSQAEPLSQIFLHRSGYNEGSKRWIIHLQGAAWWGTCGVWRVACGVWRVACDVWRVTCGVWRVACGVWRVACGVWRVTCCV
jgi:hypothetical protein